MADHIEQWTTDRVLNELLSSLERLNINQRQTGRSLFISFVWFISRGDRNNRYKAIQQLSICRWDAFNNDTKSHWNARATRLNLQPTPGLLEVWPQADLPIENIQHIVLQSLKTEMNIFARKVRNLI